MDNYFRNVKQLLRNIFEIFLYNGFQSVIMGDMKKKYKDVESYMEHLDPDFRLAHRKQVEKDIETIKKELDTREGSDIIGGVTTNTNKENDNGY